MEMSGNKISNRKTNQAHISKMTEVGPQQQQQTPAYLNESCLQKALENACKTTCSIKLENLHWKLANIVGGNYCSNIFRVNGSYKILLEEPNQQPKNFNFIIKDMDMEMAEEGTNEMILFKEILPSMMHILEGHETVAISKTSNKLSANCFYTQSNNEHEFYILEDLNALGYELGNRYEGLSLEAAKLVMEKIAKFHAASMVYAERYPDMIAKLKISSFADTAPVPPSKNLTKKCMESAMETLKVSDEIITKKLEKVIMNYKEKTREIVTPTQAGFNVLNHGDLWVNNILFKEPQQTNGDVIFVDFQNSFWGSPTTDLNYFLYSSLPLHTLQTQRFELLHHYYKTLKAMLESFKFSKIPTWSDLLKEFKRGAMIGFYVALCEFPFCVACDEAVKDFKVEEFVESKTKWKALFLTPKVCQFIWHAVLHFDEIGLFDE